MSSKAKPVVAKVGEWTAIAAVATLASDYIKDIIANWNEDGIEWHHILAVAATSIVAALVAFVQNKAGTAPAEDQDDPAE